MLTAEDYGELISIARDRIAGQTQLDALNGRKKDDAWYEGQHRRIAEYERKIRNERMIP